MPSRTVSSLEEDTKPTLITNCESVEVQVIEPVKKNHRGRFSLETDRIAFATKIEFSSKLHSEQPVSIKLHKVSSCSSKTIHPVKYF